MTTEFKAGELVECVREDDLKVFEGQTYRVSELHEYGKHCRLHGLGDEWFFLDRFVRASESQREGGFAVGQRVRLVGYAPSIDGQETTVLRFFNETTVELAPIPGAPAQKDWTVRTCWLEPADPAPAQPVEPPQPAPMTRAARVLAGLERGAHGCNDCGAVVCLGDDIRCVYCAHRDDLVIEGGTASLDSRISLAREELDRKLPKNPPEGRSDRVYNGRRW